MFNEKFSVILCSFRFYHLTFFYFITNGFFWYSLDIWEDFKNLAHLHLFVRYYLVASNCKWKMGPIFVAFSEYLNFGPAWEFYARTIKLLQSGCHWELVYCWAKMVADSAFTFVASTKPVGLEHSGRNQDRSVEKMTYRLDRQWCGFSTHAAGAACVIFSNFLPG